MRELQNPGEVYLQCMEIMARLAAKGLIHCDFNEFNLLVSQKHTKAPPCSPIQSPHSKFPSCLPCAMLYNRDNVSIQGCVSYADGGQVLRFW